MIGIPLSEVVAFLRPRGALGVLEGAPIVSADPHATLWFTWLGWQHVPASMEEGGALLYLGTGDVCPAALGWAARVLGRSRAGGSEPYRVGFFGNMIELWYLGNDEPCFKWSWPEHGFIGEDTDRVYLPGAPPPTPAARLAAVLRYELDRAQCRSDVRNCLHLWFTNPESAVVDHAQWPFVGVVIFERAATHDRPTARIAVAVDEQEEKLMTRIPFTAQPDASWKDAARIGLARSVDEAMKMLGVTP